MKTKTGPDIKDFMMQAIAIGTILIVGLLCVTIINGGVKRSENMKSVAHDVETWLVTHPGDPLSRQESFPLDDFSELSGKSYELEDSYQIHRMNDASSPSLCFEPKDSGSKLNWVYSYDNDQLKKSNSPCGE